ncbi:MAG: phosphate ABC transporter ATP-binding protein [Candidatus Margulisiibacteriota bacterium]|jgi:phosphate transport system ATP-binding protein
MVKISVENLDIWFSQNQVLKKINLQVLSHEILGIIGPANSGKTTFIRMLNRLNDLVNGFRFQGKIEIDNIDIKKMKVEFLRKKLGMVFALPAPLPLSIFDNVAYPCKIQGIKNKNELNEIVENSLKEAHLWLEVKDRLKESAFKLSGGQQQRLCIARTLAGKPEVILFDEPCSGLDPISTSKVEETMLKLKKNYTIILVTNNVNQSARVSDRTAFFLSGELVELDKTDRIFTNPKDQRTDDYIRGKFG